MKGLGLFSAILFAFLLQFTPLSAQLSLSKAPRNNAFVPRNVNTNKGTILLKGNITDPSYTGLKINVYQNNTVKASYYFTFNYSQGITSFSQNIDLTAGKYFYSIEYVLSGAGTYTMRTDGITVGDVFLVQGQSNAVACNYVNFNINYSAAYADTFIKSFGSSLYSAAAAANDTFWYKADGENAYSKACIGQWPLVIAKTLLDSFGIPICMINGAVGGTYITQHVRSTGNSTDLNSIYGRLLYRVRKAGLENNIRGIFYFQGESDGANAKVHDSLFKEIYNCWNQDYKGFKKLYVVQVRGRGCGGPSIQLRDYQRRFGQSLSKCTVVSSNGLNNHDGCHYGFANGYELLGRQLAALVSRDLYNGKATANIDPPNISRCFYSNANQDEITLEMENPSDLIFADNLFQKLFIVEGDNTVSITNGFIRNNKIVLKLSKSSCTITGLTYDSDIGTQPWVKNKMNGGLISFYNIPIARNQIQSYYTGCKAAMISMGEDSIPGCHYLWKNAGGSQVYKTARIKVKGDSVQLYSLIISYGSTACKQKDTLMVYLSPDPVMLPELGKSDTICNHDTIVFRPNFKGYSQFKWSSSVSPVSYQTFYRVGQSEHIVLQANSERLCVYKDSVDVLVAPRVLSMPKKIFVCEGTDTLLLAPKGLQQYVWNHQAGSMQFRAGPGLVELEVKDSRGCREKDTIDVRAFVNPPLPRIKLSLCERSQQMIARPSPFSKWYSNTIKLKDSISVQAGHHYPVLLADSNGCMQPDTIMVYKLTVPEFSLGNDTGLCKGDKMILELPLNMDEYSLNGKVLQSSSVQLAAAGTYIAKVKNSDQCNYSDTVNIVEYQLPDLSQFKDTVLCADSAWRVVLQKDRQYIVNGVTVRDIFSFNVAGTYALEVFSEHQCRAFKKIEIKLIDCHSSGSGSALKTRISVYPNPADGYINIISPFETGTRADLYNMSGALIRSLRLAKGVNVLDLTDCSGGFYTLCIEGIYFKVIKH